MTQQTNAEDGSGSSAMACKIASFGVSIGLTFQHVGQLEHSGKANSVSISVIKTAHNYSLILVVICLTVCASVRACVVQMYT